MKRVSDFLMMVAGTTFLVLVLAHDNAAAVGEWLVQSQGVLAVAGASLAWLAAHWGLLILALVPVAYVWTHTQAATVETEDGAQATYASYGYIEVKLIR